jgi:hypothetical protein
VIKSPFTRWARRRLNRYYSEKIEAAFHRVGIVNPPVQHGKASHALSEGCDRNQIGAPHPEPLAAGMSLQKQATLLNQPIDALGVDQFLPAGSPLAFEERSDPSVTIPRPPIDQSADVRSKLDVAETVLGGGASDAWPSIARRCSSARLPGCSYCLHWESPGAGDRDSNVSFCPFQVESLLEDPYVPGLGSEQMLQLPNSFFQLADVRSRNDFAHQPGQPACLLRSSAFSTGSAGSARARDVGQHS